MIYCFLKYELFAYVYGFYFYLLFACTLLFSTCVPQFPFPSFCPFPVLSDYELISPPHTLAKGPQIIPMDFHCSAKDRAPPFRCVLFHWDLGYPLGIWLEAREVAQATAPNCPRMPAWQACFMQPDVKVTLVNPVTVKGTVPVQSAKGSHIHQEEFNNICIIIKFSASQSHRDPGIWIFWRVKDTSWKGKQ